MNIDLNFDGEYVINDDFTIPSDYYIDSDVKDIEKLHVEGRIYYVDNELFGTLNINCNLILEDSISLESVDYPISIVYDDKIEENLQKDENKLDLFELLWENIVLEVPLKFTKVKDLSEFHGNGWKLVSEDDDLSSDNPFSDLLKNFDKKE